MIIDNFVRHIRGVDPNYSPRVILDIGSRDLGQSIEFNSVFPEPKIYAFEPNPEQFSECLRLSKEYSNIEVEQKAIADFNGTMNFFITHGNIGASSLLEPMDVPFGTTNQFSKIDVNVIKLEDWIDQDPNVRIPDIIWMDVQGAELAALYGIGDYLHSVKFIHCEAAQKAYYKGHVLKPQIEEYLTSMGFSYSFNNPAYHPYGEGDIIATNMNL